MIRACASTWVATTLASSSRPTCFRTCPPSATTSRTAARSTYDEQDDYPPFCIDAATRTIRDPGSLGVVIGGSGNGEQMAANKVRGIRAALAWNDETARLAREHNNAQIVSIGGRNHPIEDAVRFVEIFLATPFSEDPRHIRRIDMLAKYEADGTL